MSYEVNPVTLMFDDLMYYEADELIKIAEDAYNYSGTCYWENPAFVSWSNAAKFDDRQKLITYAAVFIPKAALSAALYYQKAYTEANQIIYRDSRQ